jgi:hypothetical protein
MPARGALNGLMTAAAEHTLAEKQLYNMTADFESRLHKINNGVR